MIEYKDIKDRITPSKDKCCQKCSHWEPDETDLVKRILKEDNFYKTKTRLFEEEVWVGRCDKSEDFNYYSDNEKFEYSDDDPSLVIGRQPNKSLTNFTKGSQVYFSFGYTDLATFNDFSCSEIGQDFFENIKQK
jgi:hypothetical protein